MNMMKQKETFIHKLTVNGKRRFDMKKLEMISPVTLNIFMNKYNLSTRAIAELTHSSIRSAQRWNSETGIPVSKFELLEIKVRNKMDNK